MKIRKAKDLSQQATERGIKLLRTKDRDEDPTFFSTDPDPTLNRKEEKNILIF